MMTNNSNTTTLRQRHQTTKHGEHNSNNSISNNKNRKSSSNDIILSNDVTVSSYSSTTTSQNNNVVITKNENENELLNDDDDDDTYNNDKKDKVTLKTKIPPETTAVSKTKITGHDSHYYISQWIIIRMTNMIYIVAFLIAIHQNYGLFGHENSLQPVQSLLEIVILKQQQHNEQKSLLLSFLPYWFQWRINGFIQYPMIVGWFIPYSDDNLLFVSYIGLLLSTYQFIIGFFSVSKLSSLSWLVQLLCWLLYFTIVTIATISQTSFYSYGWESQILETGFLAIFLSTTSHKPSTIIIWLYQWLSFRIAIGAGLIKLRGSSCWTDKTCLYYHFETQPIPSPLSFIFHYLSHTIHRQLVNLDLLVQVYTSWFILFPPIYSNITRCVIQYIIPTLYLKKIIVWILYFFLRTGGILQIQLMIGIILSGNFSVLNWLTIIPAIACFDDEFYPILLQKYISIPLSTQQKQPSQPSKELTHGKRTHKMNIARFIPNNLRSIIDKMLLLLILYLSKPVIDNLLQRNETKQVMNASYDPFRIVNTYGAFGSVGTERYEVILSIYNHQYRNTNNNTRHHNHKKWIEIEFPCKPGNLNRRPCFCAPYHYRIDWNIWFIGFPPHTYYLQNREVWLYSLVYKILLNENHQHNNNTTSSNSTATMSALYYKQKQQRPWLDLLDTKSSNELKKYFYDQKYNDIESNINDDNNNMTTNVGKKRHYYAPKYAKADIYHYQMSNPLWTIIWNYWNTKTTTIENITTTKYDQNGYEIGLWWKRKFKQSLIPVVKIDYQSQRLITAK